MINGRQKSGNSKDRRCRIGASLAVAALLGLATACGPQALERDPGPEDDIQSGDGTNEQGDSAGSEKDVSIRRLANNGGDFYGNNVTVSATVARIVQPEAFTLVSDEPASDEEPIEDQAVLIVSSEPVASGLSEEQSVRVEGEVRRFDLQGLEEDLGVDLQGSLRPDYGGRPAIVAETVHGT